MLGYQREKCSNYLLLKDDVGRGKPTTRDLPPEGFTFGKTEIRDLEGVGKGNSSFQNLVVTSWKFHDQSKSQKPDRDFRKLNRLGIKSGALTAKVRLLYVRTLLVIVRMLTLVSLNLRPDLMYSSTFLMTNSPTESHLSKTQPCPFNLKSFKSEKLYQ